jgi:hypothetical protein
MEESLTNSSLSPYMRNLRGKWVFLSDLLQFPSIMTLTVLPDLTRELQQLDVLEFTAIAVESGNLHSSGSYGPLKVDAAKFDGERICLTFQGETIRYLINKLLPITVYSSVGDMSKRDSSISVADC